MTLWTKAIRKQLADTQVELQVKTTEVTKFKDKEGNWVYRTQEYTKTITELREKIAVDSIELKMYEQAKNNNLKDKQIIDMKYIMANFADTLESVFRDTIIQMQTKSFDKIAEFDNGYLHADLCYDSNSDTITMTYRHNFELYITDSWYRPKSKFFLWRWLGISFKQKMVQSDYKISDPNSEVKIIRNINVSGKNKTKRK